MTFTPVTVTKKASKGKLTPNTVRLAFQGQLNSIFPQFIPAVRHFSIDLRTKVDATVNLQVSKILLVYHQRRTKVGT
jgi:hypothetical protein